MKIHHPKANQIKNQKKIINLKISFIDKRAKTFKRKTDSVFWTQLPGFQLAHK